MLIPVMFMKKKLISIGLAILTGAVLAIPALSIKKEQEQIGEAEVYVLQTGVFENYQNALENQEKMNNAIILEDEGIYRVIVGASTKESGLEKIESILKEKNIHYYKKKMVIVEQDIELFEKYNLLLENATSDEVVLLLNQKILESMVQDEL